MIRQNIFSISNQVSTLKQGWCKRGAEGLARGRNFMAVREILMGNCVLVLKR